MTQHRPTWLLPWSTAVFVVLVLQCLAAPPAGAALAWQVVPEPTSTERDFSYAIDGEHRVAYRFGGTDDGILTNRLDRQDLTDPQLVWQLLSTGGPAPRKLAHAFFDDSRGRLLVIGGLDPTAAPGGSVWAWDPSAGTWSQPPMRVGGPSAVVTGFPMAYDSRLDRLLYVDNSGISHHPQVWSLGLAADTLEWTTLGTNTNLALPANSSVAFDSLGNRLFLMTAGYTATLWQLDLSAPSAFVQVPGVTVEALAPRTIVDTARNLLVVDAPLDYPSEYASLNTFDLANLPGRSWRDKGLQPPQPVTLAWGIDRARAAIEVVGQDDYGRFQSTLTTRDALAWSNVQPLDRPYAFTGMAGALDPAGRWWYVHGGRSALPAACGNTPCPVAQLFRLSADAPELHEAIAPPGGGPGALSGHSAVLDSVGHRIVFFGGESDGGVLHSEAWALELDPPMHWQLLATNVAGPARAYHLAAIDPSTRRMYVIAGRSPDLDPQPGGLWQLDLAVEPAAWTRLGDEGLSSTLAALGYDRVGHRLLAVDGLNGTAFDLGAGPPYPVTTVPLSTGPGRIGIMGAFDPTRNLVLVHGGWYRYSNTGVVYPNNTLAWGGASFTDIGAGQPEVRPADSDALLAYDPVLDRVLMLNGQWKVTDASGYPARTPVYGLWGLSGSTGPVPTRLDFAEATVERWRDPDSILRRGTVRRGRGRAQRRGWAGGVGPRSETRPRCPRACTSISTRRPWQGSRIAIARAAGARASSR